MRILVLTLLLALLAPAAASARPLEQPGMKAGEQIAEFAETIVGMHCDGLLFNFDDGLIVVTVCTPKMAVGR
jgi:hypothetical protein